MARNIKHTEKFNNFNLIVFGGTGDLALRKIFPALYHRYVDNQLLCEYNIVAVTRKKGIENDFNKQLISFIKDSVQENKLNQKEIDHFIEKVSIVVAESNSVDGYKNLKTYLSPFNNYQNIFYFSTPSSAFGPISQALKGAGLVTNSSKVVLEKPLGHSLESSISINNEITQTFDENQIYRIDHYLGKETVQNLMVLRFANNLFERAWNAENIESIQITVSESLGVEKRAGYYDKSGALLDMVQNHLLDRKSVV